MLINIDHPRPELCLNSRLSWLTRFGALEKRKDPNEKKSKAKTQFRLTDRGDRLMAGQLREVEERMLSQVSDDAMLSVMRVVARRQIAADPVTSKLMQREWRYGTSPLRRL